MTAPSHATPRSSHALLYVFMLVMAVAYASLAMMSSPNSQSGLTLQAIFALDAVVAAVGLIAAMWDRRVLLRGTAVVVMGGSVATLLLMTIIPRPALEPALAYSGLWHSGPIPLRAGWQDLAMALALGIAGGALPLARASNLTVQIVALTIVRAVLWGAAFWQLAYATLDGNFSRLFGNAPCFGAQVGLAASALIVCVWLLRGDRRWLATMTGADNSLAMPRYILPLALAPVMVAYVVSLGVRAKSYDNTIALLIIVEFLSVFISLLGLVAVRIFWRRQRKNRKLSQALESSPVVVHTSEGFIEYWPNECELMFGFTADEAIGRRTQDLLRTQYTRPLGEIIEKLRSSGRWVGIVTHMTRDGRPLSIASTIIVHTIDDDDSIKVVATMTDITNLDY